MKFTDNYIEDFVSKLKNRSYGCTKISIIKNNKELTIMDEGPIGIFHDDEFLENLKENLFYANLSWIDSLSNLAESCHIEVDVMPDGDIDHQNINFEFKIAIPESYKSEKGQRWKGYVKKHYFEKFIVPFSKHLTCMKVKVHQYKVYHLAISGTVNASKINQILRSNAYNKSVEYQYLAEFDQFIKLKHDCFQIEIDAPVVDGELRSDKSIVRFKHK
ncbi:hypothetical protein [Pontibacillus halophilus]|uniref:hypothetical protein n=1 Tax=Pontibacillus halophilus TaxID=516704 RepID=UPI00040B94C6|nr:hypothetical protein [Pontibacillus halophilus]